MKFKTEKIRLLHLKYAEVVTMALFSDKDGNRY